ncbi:hypothetical protein [Winogradskyella sp. SYSU M77433]|uniref:hypothetical protein n=1 Tax=Winogradskyella sp. SYSU M77433 TaxID=3042722 RepID=UPI002480D2BD|nr:hypothetical protein [Winogradskyella sp. SYSU M77433]MDH7914402.1 hypothetical protein [Winogradskyella sp. SYSU M77433]
MIKKMFLATCIVAFSMYSCSSDDDNNTRPAALDPETAPKASVDRFSENAGTLMVRTATNGLPEANEPINYDSGAPFITQGFSPSGDVVRYYNFDVQSTNPAPIFLFFDTEGNAVENQINLIDVIPGDAGYNDFWQVNRVIVSDDYVANTITSMQDLLASGYEIQATSTIVNCPVVPEGSTASMRLGSEDNEIHMGWYKDQVVYYFSFFEKILDGGASNIVPLSPIYVSFNINPDDSNPESGPASGFVSETGTDQTHNVIASLPQDDFYSPLWSVNVYDNMDFDIVNNLSSAGMANILATGVATVNCPVVFME